MIDAVEFLPLIVPVFKLIGPDNGDSGLADAVQQVVVAHLVVTNAVEHNVHAQERRVHSIYLADDVAQTAPAEFPAHVHQSNDIIGVTAFVATLYFVEEVGHAEIIESTFDGIEERYTEQEALYTEPHQQHRSEGDHDVLDAEDESGQGFHKTIGLFAGSFQ